MAARANLSREGLGGGCKEGENIGNATTAIYMSPTLPTHPQEQPAGGRACWSRESLEGESVEVANIGNAYNHPQP